MSKLGYINRSYGKEINLAIANTYSYNVLGGSNLPANSLIIASNVDEDGNDTGSYSLLSTDSYGNAVRLTYSISEGNGLYYSKDDDSLSLHIDNDTIINTNSGLTFDLASQLSNDFLVIDKNNVVINTNNIKLSSKSNYGIAAIDGKTLKINDSRLYVDTSNLMYSNNETLSYGIAIGDNKSIYIENGKISVITDSLSKATDNEFGLVLGDNHTVDINEGIISVNTAGLDFATRDSFGISKPDNTSIIFNSDNEITLNESNIPTAGTNSYGIAKVDNQSLNINDGKISFKDYSTINTYISKYNKIKDDYKQKINEYNEYLSSGNKLFKDKDIELFVVNQTSMWELPKPKENEDVIYMKEHTVSAVFDIVTTCDFILSMQYEPNTNEFPTVDLIDVNYDDKIIYKKQEALSPSTVYPSTKGEKKQITVRFAAKNFKNSNKGEYLITSINFIISNAEDHLKYKTNKYSIVRYNSLYEALKKEEEERAGAKEKKYYVVEQNTAMWRYIQ